MRLHFLITACIIASFIIPANGQIEDHYLGKTVQVLMPIPENIPMMVFDREGKPFDVELMKLKFERSGIGLDAGTFAVITKAGVDGDEFRITLVGTGDTPPPPGLPATAFDDEVWKWGSGTISVKFDQPVSRLENPVTRINALLANVITTRELISAEGLPEHFQKAVREGELLRGMNQKAVYLIMGPPDDVIRELQGEIIAEAWIYRAEDLSTVTVMFRDGIVYLIKTY